MAKKIESKDIEALKLKRDQAKLQVIAGQAKSLKEYRNLKAEVARALTLERQNQK